MKLSSADVDQRMKNLAGWTLYGDEIRKQFTFKDFPEAVAFVDRLAPEAEAVGRGPRRGRRRGAGGRRGADQRQTSTGLV